MKKKQLMRFLLMWAVFLAIIAGVYTLIVRIFGSDRQRAHRFIERSAFTALILGTAFAAFCYTSWLLLFGIIRIMVAFLLLYILSLALKWRDRGRNPF